MTTAMRARIDAIRAAGGAEPRSSSSISPEASERLRALGYVAGGASREAAEGAPNPAGQIAVWNAFEDALAELNAQRPDAVPALKRIAGAHPSSAIFQTMYARALEETGRETDAIAVYRAAARKWPTDAALLHDFSVAARNAAKHASGPPARALLQEAARAEQAALVVAPGSAASQNGLGLLAIDADRPRDAAAAFERAAARDPGNASYWTNLGNARRALHDASGAEQAYRRALDVDARAADAANGLGALLVEANRAPEAVAWLERAVAAAPDLVDARLNLGIALQQAGDTTRAAESYRAVLAAAGSDSRQKQAAAHLLAALGAAR
jgi:tetratricopeptide (TPR) repeat protein